MPLHSTVTHWVISYPLIRLLYLCSSLVHEASNPATGKLIDSRFSNLIRNLVVAGLLEVPSHLFICCRLVCRLNSLFMPSWPSGFTYPRPLSWLPPAASS